MTTHRDIRHLAERVIAGDLDALAPLMDALHEMDHLLWVALVCRLGGGVAALKMARSEYAPEVRPSTLAANVRTAVWAICWPYIDAPGAITALSRAAGMSDDLWQGRRDEHQARAAEDLRPGRGDAP